MMVLPVHVLKELAKSLNNWQVVLEEMSAVFAVGD